ncbi:hypothetical protein NEIELOOT_00983 [Neisseria elongata subsp. glycolytica ATCC 29315]|uniref:Uncharacterized protein n=1 Tax=Neisseria elongata subsp. glycolytica ATCC 29315 TaxID=546263 RepID=D4DPJ6_NEIEG|nr:hypothetical protein NEIELOOT_00983 [Neisseria elongata subsp. glycolytica ATCC 29315]
MCWRIERQAKREGRLKIYFASRISRLSVCCHLTETGKETG